jgi:hypothetical protein
VVASPFPVATLVERMTQQWKRLNNESSKAYAAFSIYRDLRIERSLEKVAEECHKSSRLIGRWSSKYHWVERATAYDDHLDEQRQKRWQAKLIAADDETLEEAIELRRDSFKIMQNDKPGSWAVTHRWLGAVDVTQKISGRDTKKVEIAGKVKIDNTSKLMRIKTALDSSLNDEARLKLSEELLKLAEEDDK